MDLTKRELDVLTLIAQGRSNKDRRPAGRERQHLKTYIRTAYKKIGVTSRAQAFGWMVDNGVIAGQRSAG